MSVVWRGGLGRMLRGMKLTRRWVFSPLKKTLHRLPRPLSAGSCPGAPVRLAPWACGGAAALAGAAPERASPSCSRGRVEIRLTWVQGSLHGPQRVESNKQAPFHPARGILGRFSQLTRFRTVFTDPACLTTLYLKLQKQTCNVLYFNINIHSWSLQIS